MAENCEKTQSYQTMNKNGFWNQNVESENVHQQIKLTCPKWFAGPTGSVQFHLEYVVIFSHSAWATFFEWSTMAKSSCFLFECWLKEMFGNNFLINWNVLEMIFFFQLHSQEDVFIAQSLVLFSANDKCVVSLIKCYETQMAAIQVLLTRSCEMHSC